jgi:hypothetical protein
MKRLAVILCAMATLSCAGPDTSSRPEARPNPTADATVDRSATENKRGFFKSLRPIFRSSDAVPAAMAPQSFPVAGSVCGDPSIRGEVVGRVSGRISGCGIENGVRITAVSGVELSVGSTMDCPTARALRSWVDSSAKPAFSSQVGGLREIKVAAHYACRRRNNAKTGKISEHGKGKAIDISVFRMVDGSEITVLKGWNAASSRKAMRRVHADACGPFGTVLGPKANRFHLDHFHFGTASYRSGPFCR